MTHQNQLNYLPFFKDSLKRFLPNTQVVSLVVIISVCFGLIYYLSSALMPVFISIVLAYLLEGIVNKAEQLGLPRLLAVCLVFFCFMTGLGFLLFYLIPLVSQQTVELVQHIPDIINRAQHEISRLPKTYPQFISENRIQQIILSTQRELLTYGQTILSLSAASVVGLVSTLTYLFLVPMMVFFFLKDKKLFVDWFLKFIPKESNLTVSVWKEVDVQIANYIRGKISEVVIVWLVSYITLISIGINYAMLLAVLMGLSVIIPYIGATLVTIPVLFVAYFQWDLNADEFMYVLIAYSSIQILDGILLTPILFSEAVNLHAVAIIIAILFFGSLWGFWGIFFAIPLATVVKAVLNAWPQIDTNNLENINNVE